MIKPAELVRPVTLGCALVICATASAQVGTPAGDPTAAPAITPATTQTGVIVAAPVLTAQPVAPTEGTQSGTFNAAPGVVIMQRLDSVTPGVRFQPFEDRQKQLREQLADPKQREKLISERTLQLRRTSPDLARLLRIDAGTEQKLLALLVDQQLAAELREFPTSWDLGEGTDLMAQTAQEYEQQNSDISRVIGTTKLDAYLDYDRMRFARVRVHQFDVTWPAANKLSDAQKDALVPLVLEEDEQRMRSATLSRGMLPLMRMEPGQTVSAETLQRRSQLFQVSVNEQMARESETSTRKLLQRLPSVLDAEQLRLFAEQRAQQTASTRAYTEQVRREAGIGTNELPALEDESTSSTVPSVSLQLTLRINGTDLSRTLTSTRGGVVRFSGPGGSLIEIKPFAPSAQQLPIELSLYEPASSGRRLVGRMATQANLIDPRQQAAQGFSSSRSMLRGRKGYLVDWGATATLR